MIVRADIYRMGGAIGYGHTTLEYLPTESLPVYLDIPRRKLLYLTQDRPGGHRRIPRHYHITA
jgi:hypothetical protein